MGVCNHTPFLSRLVSQWRSLFIVRPRYLTCFICKIYWPLILKFRCFVMFLLDLGLNSKILVLLIFRDILFALSHVVRIFKSWLMCFYIFFKELCTSSKLLSPKWPFTVTFCFLLVRFFVCNNCFQLFPILLTL